MKNCKENRENYQRGRKTKKKIERNAWEDIGEFEREKENKRACKEYGNGRDINRVKEQ